MNIRAHTMFVDVCLKPLPKLSAYTEGFSLGDDTAGTLCRTFGVNLWTPVSTRTCVISCLLMLTLITFTDYPEMISYFQDNEAGMF
jgi:hypothetical protein